jgi:hypothetical protein
VSTSVCQINANEIAADVRENVFPSDIASRLGDEHSQFDFMLDFMDLSEGKVHFTWVVSDGGPRLEEQHRGFGYF